MPKPPCILTWIQNSHRQRSYFLQIEGFQGGLDSLSRLRIQYSPAHSTDVTASTCSHSWNSWCRCRVLEEWATSTAASSSWAEEASFYRKPAFNAQQSRVGDICKVGKRIQSVFDTPHNIHLMPSTDSDIIHVNALGIFWIRTKRPSISLTKDPVSIPVGRLEYHFQVNS